jgi:hypothetical protein
MSIHSLSTEISTPIIANCCHNKVTFGNALLVIAQVALTRVLYRRYMSGEISSTEWEQRRREPMHICGPLNIRPFLDKAWVENGVPANSVSLLDFLLHVVLYAARSRCTRQRRQNIIRQRSTPVSCVTVIRPILPSQQCHQEAGGCVLNASIIFGNGSCHDTSEK